jgi:hypothetical protein
VKESGLKMKNALPYYYLFSSIIVYGVNVCACFEDLLLVTSRGNFYRFCSRDVSFPYIGTPQSRLVITDVAFFSTVQMFKAVKYERK